MPEAGLREARTFGLEAPNGWISDNPKWWDTLLTLTLTPSVPSTARDAAHSGPRQRAMAGSYSALEKSALERQTFL